VIKVCTGLPRRADLTLDAFQHHWATIHRDHAQGIDRIARYVQSHRIPVDLPGLPPVEFDGFPEVWFSDLDAALGLATDPQYVEGAHRDEPVFVDVDHMVRTWTTPLVVREWDGFTDVVDAGKVLLLVSGHRTADVRDRLADASLTLEPRRLAVGTAVTDPRVADRQSFDHVVEMWWDDLATAEAAWRRRSAHLLGSLFDALDPKTSRAALVRESRVRWPGDIPVDA
jgi:hypothetical protein